MNKRNIWIIGAGSILLGLTGSCSLSDADDLPAPGEAGGVPVVTYSFRPQLLQRASVQENDLAFRWDRGDRLTIWKGASGQDAEACGFETEEGGLGTALFRYVGSETDSKVYFGFYPEVPSASSRTVSVTLPATGIRQEANNSSLHVKNFRPMYAPVVVREANGLDLPGLRFRHLTALWVFQVKNRNQTPLRLRSITVQADVPVFYTKAEYVAGSDAVRANPDEQTKVSALTLLLGKDGIDVLPEGVIKAFMPLWPSADLSSVGLKVMVESENMRYETLELSGNSVGDRDGNGIMDFAPSYYYSFNLGVKNQHLQWDDTDIESWEEGEMTEIPVG